MRHDGANLTRVLAIELVPYNITVNAICPGYVDSPMTEETIANITKRTGRSEAEARKAIEGMSPQNRLIEPEEVAAVAVMLAVDQRRRRRGHGLVPSCLIGRFSWRRR